MINILSQRVALLFYLLTWIFLIFYLQEVRYTFTITENDSLRDKRDAYKKSSLQSKQFHGPFARPWDVHVALRDGNETW